MIAANKTATYSAFLFGGVYQSWGEGDGEKRVGFSSETQDNSYFVPSYFIDGIVPIDSTSNTDTPGLWSFRIDAENVILPGECMQCLQIAAWLVMFKCVECVMIVFVCVSISHHFSL